MKGAAVPDQMPIATRKTGLGSPPLLALFGMRERRDPDRYSTELFGPESLKVLAKNRSYRADRYENQRACHEDQCSTGSHRRAK